MDQEYKTYDSACTVSVRVISQRRNNRMRGQLTPMSCFDRFELHPRKKTFYMRDVMAIDVSTPSSQDKTMTT
jgi:hypothetical protein